MNSKSTTDLIKSYYQRQTVSYQLPTCYSHSIIHSGDAELSDDSYDDDLLGNELFCRDYGITAH